MVEGLSEFDGRGPINRPTRFSPAVRNLLADARQHLADAEGARTPAGRYISAHVAALRAASALIASRPRPDQGRRRRVRSAWELLPAVEPALGEWAAFFARSAVKRAAAEAGVVRGVSAADADDLLAESERFVSQIESELGIAAQPSLPLGLAG